MVAPREGNGESGTFCLSKVSRCDRAFPRPPSCLDGGFWLTRSWQQASSAGGALPYSVGVDSPLTCFSGIQNAEREESPVLEQKKTRGVRTL